jgi:hypothetical protein
LNRCLIFPVSPLSHLARFEGQLLATPTLLKGHRCKVGASFAGSPTDRCAFSNHTEALSVGQMRAVGLQRSPLPQLSSDAVWPFATTDGERPLGAVPFRLFGAQTTRPELSMLARLREALEGIESKPSPGDFEGPGLVEQRKRHSRSSSLWQTNSAM